uniref:NR LBD domain-containing protein n=1 Tax=Meloidogyne hapla TaxID=6305 RepID=A0A1I8BK78_MELHA
MKRERQFTTLLTSTTTPIHPSIQDALKMPSSFQHFNFHEQNQMKTEDQMNFSYWRAKILSTTIEWAKSFDEFSALKYEDREALIVHSCFSILVFSEAFHTSERYTDRIVFPGGLSGFRNLSANIIKERSGLIPTVVAVINQILVPIRRMKMTEIEYVLLCAIIFFDPECLTLSKNATKMIISKREALLAALQKHLDEQMPNKIEASIHMAELILRISNVHKVAAFKRETLCTIETFNLMSPHPLTMELSKKYAEISFF